MNSVQIPDKVFFKIGEVSEIVGVKPHVLRYWESEFPTVRPVKSHGKQRLYRKNHIEQLLHLKELLHHQGFTLAGAKKQLRVVTPVVDSVVPDEMPLLNRRPFLLDEIRRDLRLLRQSLS